jgi:hypothetical protein
MDRDLAHPIHQQFCSNCGLAAAGSKLSDRSLCWHKGLDFPMKFEWDPRKAESNLGKHGVSFDEVASVFLDRLAFQALIQITLPANCGILPLGCPAWADYWLFRIRIGPTQFESSMPVA